MAAFHFSICKREERVEMRSLLWLQRVSLSTILGLLKTRASAHPWHRLSQPPGRPFEARKAPAAPNEDGGRAILSLPVLLTQIAKARNDCTSPKQQLESRVSQTRCSWSRPARRVVDRVAGKTQIKSQRLGLLPNLAMGSPCDPGDLPSLP